MSTRKAAESWLKLRQMGFKAGNNEVPSLLAGVGADAGPVRFALGQHGEGRLLLPLSASERVPRIPETPTLRIVDDIYHFGPEKWRFLDLTCLVLELDGVFGEVADEIVRRISDGHGALEASVKTLGEFRLLLVPRTTKVADREIVGLVGELLLLEELLALDMRACDLWRGPFGERHDFRAGTLAVEVKTSSRAGNEIMHISSIDQLLEPADGELCVSRYTLEQSTGGTLSVGSLFARISGKTGDPLQLRDLLARMGCQDPNSPDWNSQTFDVEETRTYLVSERFPRLVPSSLSTGSLPAGVDCVTYDVELGAARDCLLSSDGRTAFLERMIACLPND